MCLGVLFFSNTLKASSWGEGQLQLTKSMADYFMKFVRGKGKYKPADFYVTLDGTDGTSWVCGEGTCMPGSAVEDVKDCERKTGKKCAKFAFKKTIKWKNGINTGHWKKSSMDSKWSDQEMYAKLTELGFYNNDFSKSVETEVKTTKKKKPKKVVNSTSNLTKELKSLKQLLDDEILTQEEFTDLKKDLLQKYKD